MIDLIKKIIKDFIKDFDTSIMAADPEEEIDKFLDEWVPKQLPPKTIFKITDPAKLKELWDELQQKLINDPKFIPLISLPAPSKEITCYLDGTALCIVGPTFINLQESDAMFIPLTPDQIAEFKKIK